jgi:hypothetical protein
MEARGGSDGKCDGPSSGNSAATKKIWLDGDPFDLDDLAELLPSGDVRVVREGEEFYLTSPDIDNPREGQRHDEVAETLIARINGIGAVRYSNFRPVALRGTYTEGETQHSWAKISPMEARVRMQAAMTQTDSDGNIVPDEPSPWPDRLSQAASHPDLDKVLGIMGRSKSLGWADLYKVFEFVRRSVPEDEMQQRGWATKRRLSLFRQTAQAERHAHSSVPADPMPLPVARDLVNHLVTAWMSTLTR